MKINTIRAMRKCKEAGYTCFDCEWLNDCKNAQWECLECLKGANYISAVNRVYRQEGEEGNGIST